MPDPLEIAQHRMLVEKLKEKGQSTTEAEMRLRDMLHLLSAMHGNYVGSADAQPETDHRSRG